MKNKMAKPLGLTSRGRSMQVRVVIPKDLREVYDGRSDIRISLGTLTGAAARAEAHRIRAAKETEFEDKRRTPAISTAATAIKVVTPDLGRAIASAVYAAGMAQDDNVRDGAEGRAALAELASITNPGAGLRIPAAGPSPVPDLLAGIPDDSAAVLADLNALGQGDAAINLARRNLASVQPQADAAARSLGLAVDWSTDSARQALRHSLEAQRSAWGDRSRRDLGEVILTPIAPLPASAAPAEKLHTLQEVLPLWEASKRPAASTAKKVAYAVRLADECLGATSLASITKAQGTEFIGYLLKKCKAEKTAKDHLDAVKSLLNFACDQQDWIAINPWRAHRITVKKSRPRKPWPSEGLVKLIDSQLFRSYTLPTRTDAGGAAAYWVTLLGLYTGARQSELCQLRAEDVSEDASGLTLSILSDAGDDDEDVPETSTKHDTTQRRVPIHSDLIRLGFADFVRDARTAGQALLFPAVRRAPNRPAGEYYSDWFSDYRKEQGITQRFQDFHAFRHTARTRLTDAGVEGVLSDALLGHSATGSTGRRIYDHSISTLRPAMEKLSFPELRLVRVYPST